MHLPVFLLQVAVLAVQALDLGLTLAQVILLRAEQSLELI